MFFFVFFLSEAAIFLTHLCVPVDKISSGVYNFRLARLKLDSECEYLVESEGTRLICTCRKLFVGVIWTIEYIT